MHKSTHARKKTLNIDILATSSNSDKRFASHKSDNNMSDEFVILKPKILQVIDQIREKKPLILAVYDFIARTCVTNISKELLELVIEELINQNVIFNKKKCSRS